MLILAIVLGAIIFSAGYFIGIQNEGIPEGMYDGQLIVKSVAAKDDGDDERVVLSMQFEKDIDIDDIENKKHVTFQVVTQ